MIRISILIGLISVVFSRKIGICVEECSIVQEYGCSAGYECRSNGCGHSCRPVGTVDPPDQIGLCVEECYVTRETGCPVGFQCIYNGCGHTCIPSGVPDIVPDIVCVTDPC